MRTALYNNAIIQGSHLCRFLMTAFIIFGCFYILYASPFFHYTYTITRLQVIYFMLTIRHSLKTEHANAARVSRRVLSTFIMGSVVMLGISGCGQKGALYLTDASGQTVQESTAVLASTSQPQDAAFAGIDDDQQISDFELPEPSNDPNDY